MEQEQKNTVETDNSIVINEIAKDIAGIGFGKYNFLKTLNYEKLTEKEKNQIKNFENRICPDPEAIAREQAYLEKIRHPKPQPVTCFTSKQIWDEFLKKFKEINKKDFLITQQTKENIAPLIHYFAKDERFFNCKNLTDKSKACFNKGLLIIGGYGNGKTAAMKTLEAVFKPIKGYAFKGYSANETVKMYELSRLDKTGIIQDEFEKTIFRGNRYFDDVKTERNASSYGVVNLFKDILERRSELENKTYITCNFKEGHGDDLDEALNDFEDKYGGRVYDRLFQMFNILEFKGRSFRK